MKACATAALRSIRRCDVTTAQQAPPPWDVIRNGAYCARAV